MAMMVVMAMMLDVNDKDGNGDGEGDGNADDEGNCNGDDNGNGGW